MSISIIQNPDNQLEHQVYGSRSQKIYYRGTAEGCLNYIKHQRARIKRNAARRGANAALRELCGTSAAAARRDMGI